ncbi:MAG: glycosyltransferase [Candidatus Riflebacteria bacterium]|nr:glycosyltransferase [Candidatus Riflebacteria bacterium]
MSDSKPNLIQGEDTRPTRFCFEGDYCAPTASGRITRELVLAARGLEMPLSLRERKAYGPRLDEPLPTFLQQLAKRPPSGHVRIFCLPAFALPDSVERGAFWAISGFDAVHPMPGEIASMKRVEKLWVPSAMHRRVLQKSGMPAMKLEILPPAVNRKIFHPRAESVDELGPNAFRFLAVVNPLRRKGIDLILRAYIEEFKSGEPVRLILKLTHMPKLKKDFAYEISDLGKRLGALNKMFAPVVVYSETWSDAKLAGLMAGCQAFVTANRAYHTALAAREAMAAGLPVVGPACLADLIGLNEETGYLVPTHEAPIEADGLFANSPATVIDEVDIAAMRKRMREAFTEAKHAREKGRMASRAGRADPDWKTLAAAMLSAAPRPVSKPPSQTASAAPSLGSKPP